MEKINGYKIIGKPFGKIVDDKVIVLKNYEEDKLCAGYNKKEKTMNIILVESLEGSVKNNEYIAFDIPKGAENIVFGKLESYIPEVPEWPN